MALTIPDYKEVHGNPIMHILKEDILTVTTYWLLHTEKIFDSLEQMISVNYLSHSRGILRKLKNNYTTTTFEPPEKTISSWFLKVK